MQSKFLQFIVMSDDKFDSSIFTRSSQSYVAEWIGHNFMYGLPLFNSLKARAADVDLNNRESRGLLWGIISAFVGE